MEPRELDALLRRHLPADPREAGHRARMLELLSIPRPFDRATFEPGHFTASAFVRSADLQSILLIHHAKLGIWVQPGGHLEASDPSVTAAAVREVLEETGVAAVLPDGASPGLFDLDVHRIPARKDEPTHEHFDVRFAFVARSDTLSPSSEVRAARWVRLDEVPRLTTDESVLRALRKLGPPL